MPLRGGIEVSSDARVGGEKIASMISHEHTHAGLLDVRRDDRRLLRTIILPFISYGRGSKGIHHGCMGAVHRGRESGGGGMFIGCSFEFELLTSWSSWYTLSRALSRSQLALQLGAWT